MNDKPVWNNEHERQKFLKFGKRGYEHCGHSLKRLTDYDKAVFDEELDIFFESHEARIAYVREGVKKRGKKSGD